jgi:hypothetical protein
VLCHNAKWGATPTCVTDIDFRAEEGSVEDWIAVTMQSAWRAWRERMGLLLLLASSPSHGKEAPTLRRDSLPLVLASHQRLLAMQTEVPSIGTRDHKRREIAPAFIRTFVQWHELHIAAQVARAGMGEQLACGCGRLRARGSRGRRVAAHLAAALCAGDQRATLDADQGGPDADGARRGAGALGQAGVRRKHVTC